MAKPIAKTKKLKDDTLMQYVEQIITKMRDLEAVFATPVPTLVDMEQALLAFRLAASDAAHRDKRAIMVRNSRRKELEYLLRELSKYVDTVAKGDASTVLSSGFEVSAEATSYAGLVPKATQLIAEPQIGSSRIRVKILPWKGARMYQFEFRQKGETIWSTKLSSKSSCLLEDLEMFAQYEFRATYIGIDPQRNYSDTVSSYVV